MHGGGDTNIHAYLAVRTPRELADAYICTQRLNLDTKSLSMYYSTVLSSLVIEKASRANNA